MTSSSPDVSGKCLEHFSYPRWVWNLVMSQANRVCKHQKDWYQTNLIGSTWVITIFLKKVCTAIANHKGYTSYTWTFLLQIQLKLQSGIWSTSIYDQYLSAKVIIVSKSVSLVYLCYPSFEFRWFHSSPHRFTFSKCSLRYGNNTLRPEQNHRHLETTLSRIF